MAILQVIWPLSGRSYPTLVIRTSSNLKFCASRTHDWHGMHKRVFQLVTEEVMSQDLFRH